DDSERDAPDRREEQGHGDHEARGPPAQVPFLHDRGDRERVEHHVERIERVANLAREKRVPLPARDALPPGPMSWLHGLRELVRDVVAHRVHRFSLSCLVDVPHSTSELGDPYPPPPGVSITKTSPTFIATWA